MSDSMYSTEYYLACENSCIMSFVANPDDITMGSGLSQLGLGDYRFTTYSLCYTLGV